MIFLTNLKLTVIILLKGMKFMMKAFPLLEKTNYLEKLPVRVSTQCLREKNHLHMHRHIQICYVLSGTLCHFIDGEEYIQSPNSCAFILPYMHHRTDLANSEDTPIVVFITFHEDFIRDYGEDIFPHSRYFNGHRIPVIREFETDEARELIHKLIDEFHIDGDNDFKTIASDLASLFRLACTTRARNFPARVIRNRVYDINRAVTYMAEHYPEKLTIDDLAAYSNMSRSTFTTNFKSVTGLSFLDMLVSIRLDAAFRCTPGMKPDEIAAEIGLHDRTNLTRVFKKYLGMTLNEIREARKENKPKPNAKSSSLLDWIYTNE